MSVERFPPFPLMYQSPCQGHVACFEIFDVNRNFRFSESLCYTLAQPTSWCPHQGLCLRILEGGTLSEDSCDHIAVASFWTDGLRKLILLLMSTGAGTWRFLTGGKRYRFEILQ